MDERRTKHRDLAELMADYILQAEQLRRELPEAVTAKEVKELHEKADFVNNILGALARLATGEIPSVA